MCCQDGDGAIWQMLYEPARWSAEVEGSFNWQEELVFEDLPTGAAELMIKLVAIQDTDAGKGAVSPALPRRGWQIA